jgi:hypothetical protein
VAAQPTSTVQEVLADGTTSASQAVGAALADSVELLPVAAQPTSTVQEVLANGTTSASQAVGAAHADSVELLPSDLQEDVAELQRKPCEMLAPACRWLLYFVVIGALYYGLFQLYFGRLQCPNDDDIRHWLETVIGWGRLLLYSALWSSPVEWFVRWGTGARGDGLGLGMALITMPSAAGDEDIVRRAGWERIVGRSGAQAEPLFWILLVDLLTNTQPFTKTRGEHPSQHGAVFTGIEDMDGGGGDDGADDVAPPPQSTWEEAREARKLTCRQVSREYASF